MKKRWILPALICALLLSLAGCKQPAMESEKPSIICTVFPQYDWVRNILGEHEKDVNLTLLMDNGADLHNYQATVSDLVDIGKCDLFVYIGGQSDQWVKDALKNPSNKERQTLALLDMIKPIEEEHDHDEEEHEHEEAEYDEHVWLSLKNADVIIAKLTEMISAIDPEHAADYQKNAATYRAALQALEAEYQSSADTALRKVMVFADRFPFSYLARDYGLTAYAAFSGCSAESEASFATLTLLTEKINEFSLPAIMVIETSDQSIAKTVIQNSKQKNQEIIVADSMQSVTRSRIDSGETYLSIMKNNLTAFHKALH